MPTPDPTRSPGSDPAPARERGVADAAGSPAVAAAPVELDLDLDPRTADAAGGTAAAVPLVALGASAGGLEPLERFFATLPARTGCAWVVIQHLSPEFKSIMGELLSRHTSMPVVRVEDGMVLEPDSVYLIPPRRVMLVEEGRLRLVDPPDPGGRTPSYPIDRFFESAAAACGPRTVAVVLSGTGSDGSRGIRAVGEAGGVVMVQDPESAEFDGMPRSAMRTGVVARTGDPAELARAVMHLVRTREVGGPAAGSTDAADADGETPAWLMPTLDLLRRVDRVDLSSHRPDTLVRHVERRALLGGFHDVSVYVRQLEEDAGERAALRRDMLVHVTRFFREPDAWEALRRSVIARLVGEVPEGETIRAWVAGCSTGEEAYTLGMLFLDAMEEAGHGGDLKLFASDVDREVLEVATSGRYPEGAEGDLRTADVNRHLVRRGRGWQVVRKLREKMIFARHDLLHDAPFTRMHLVCCRNLLPCLRSDARTRAVSALHFALRPQGFLMLGASESLAGLEDEFTTLDRRWRIFEKRRDRPAATIPWPGRRDAGGARESGGGEARRGVGDRVRPELIVESGLTTLLAGREAACLVVSTDHELLHAYGRTDLFLGVPAGAMTRGVTRLLRRELVLPAGIALHRAARSNEPVAFGGVRIERPDGEGRRVELRATRHPGDRWSPDFLVLVLELAPEAAGAAPAFDAEDEAASQVAMLEGELQRVRENLQSTIRELETANEEQQSTNQELLASNEELQSTNEELHSVNEELSTVNAEHQARIAELSDLNADIENLFVATDVGTIFLDERLRIRRFTNAARVAVNLDERDLDRPFDDLGHRLEYRDLAADIRRVLEAGEVLERDVRTREGVFLLMRLHPYRAGDHSIRGVVMTFVDISDRKRVEHELRGANIRLRARTREMEEFAYTVSHDLQSPLVTIGDMFGMLEEAIRAGAPLAELLGLVARGEGTVAKMRATIDDLLELSRAGRVRSDLQPVSLGELVREVVAARAQELGAGGIEVVVDPWMPDVPADRPRLQQVFDNLVVNAMKHGMPDAECGRPRRIEIGCALGDGRVSVFVSDHGPGVPPAESDRVFAIFSQVHPGESDGAGVGLAIVKRVVEAHGGAVRVETTEGGGATFWLDLPTGIADPADPGIDDR